MQPKYILNADDFGPIDFINQGINENVATGKINSVQVIVNGDTESSLKAKLAQLARAVPLNTVLDIGVHLTITSGRPMFLRRRSDTNIKHAWKKMVVKKVIAGVNGSKYVFKDFKNFYLGYVDGKTDPSKLHLYNDYKKCIQSEFEMQTDRLADVVDAVNLIVSPSRLAFTSISSHHNIVAANDDLFEMYTAMATHNNRNLSVRAPKLLPKFRSRVYTAVVLQIANSEISKEHSEKLTNMNSAFIKNRYHGANHLPIKSPCYSDMRHYSGGGSLGYKRDIQTKKIRNTKKKFDRMVDCALDYNLVSQSDPPNKKVVELVFHLGGIRGQRLATLNDQRRSVAHYPGIEPKYFDNRMIESEALDKISLQGKHSLVFGNMVSWDHCGVVTYRKTP